MSSDLDPRTAAIIDALASPGSELLYTLLVAGPLTEQQLVERTGTSQPTANRRLADFARLGIAARTAGRSHAPNRPWHVLHRPEAKRLILSAIELSELTGAREAAMRISAKEKLERAERALRIVDDPGQS